MSLKRPDVPGQILRAFTTGLGDFIPSGSPLWSLLLSKYFPLQQHNISLPAVATSDKLTMLPTFPESALVQTGWRFHAAEGDLYGACHVGSIRQGAAPILTGFSDDPLVLTAVENLNQVETVLAQSPIHGHFTPSVLRIPWLRLEAFWLHADRVGSDLVVPHAGIVGDEPAEQPKTDLKMMTHYGVGDFLGKIQPVAKHLHK